MSGDDPEIEMLQSMFSQVPKQVIVKVYVSQSRKNFDMALNVLLDMVNPDPLKVKEEVLKYEQLSRRMNFQKIIKWKVFDRKNKNHMELLDDLEDPLTLDPFLEAMADDRKLQVVQLPCATKRLKCNFIKENIIEALMAKAECPLCHTYYPIPGKQPSGTMSVKLNRSVDCQGYKGQGTISIKFTFPNGVQGPNHQDPGGRFSGTSRIAYLPHTKEGKEALQLLKKGFLRGELFTIGRSLTTGQQNTVTWGSVHMKTSPTGGKTYHGWPDDTYFQRLKAECAAKMIFLDDEEETYMGPKKNTTKTIIL